MIRGRLILIPTEFERRVIVPIISGCLLDVDRVATCGFGAIAAAARTSQLIAALQPSEVVLAGIAGCLDERAALGTAWLFGRVAATGIGAGAGESFTPSSSMGWPQWAGDPPDPGETIGDEIVCRENVPRGIPTAPLLITACAAAAGSDDVRLRKALHPEAWAEDMEGFAVALASRLHRVPCSLLRGISNVAGDRDRSGWRTRAALEAVAELLRIWMADAS